MHEQTEVYHGLHVDTLLFFSWPYPVLTQPAAGHQLSTRATRARRATAHGTSDRIGPRAQARPGPAAPIPSSTEVPTF
jgi:hypothetical protein